MAKEEKGFILFTIKTRACLTGFLGGIIISLLWLFLYYFNFTELTFKSLVLRSWLTYPWTSGWIGDLLSLFLVSLISIIVAFVYYLFFKKVNTIWMGISYGFILWVILFFILIPLFPNIKTDLMQINNISLVGMFIIYGTFIGYSISFDYEETKRFSMRKHVK